MSKISKNPKEKHFKAIGDQHKFFRRITKTLYYGKLPTSDRLSLPVTEYASELFSEAQSGRSLERLHSNDAATISRNACVSPCSFILAMLYLERLKNCNPDYLLQISPSDLFLVSLMISSKFLYDDGEEDEVFIDEWAVSGGISIKDLRQLEKGFLTAIDWEIFVNESTFWRKLKQLENTIAKRVGLTRGWFTYTELESLLVSIDINAVMHYIAILTAILMITYTVGILTIISSVFVISHLPGIYLQHTTNVSIDQRGIEVSATKHSDRLMKTNNCDETLMKIRELDFCFNQESHQKKQIDAVDVLQTGLILASIKTSDLHPELNKSDSELENLDTSNNRHAISWDWWTSPTMEWLSRKSSIIQNFYFIPEYKHYTYTDVAKSRMIDLDDHAHMETKIRNQDQLERSWHKEWTDMIKNTLFILRPFSYLQDIKS